MKRNVLFSFYVILRTRKFNLRREVGLISMSNFRKIKNAASEESKGGLKRTMPD